MGSREGHRPWAMTGTHIASFLIEASHGKHSVPRHLYNAFAWWRNTMRLPWPTDDEAVLSVTSLSAKQARQKRRQAKPYTHDIVADIISQFIDADETEDNVAWRCALAFVSTLALACLRFSDLHRSGEMTMGRDCFFWEYPGEQRQAGSSQQCGWPCA